MQSICYTQDVTTYVTVFNLFTYIKVAPGNSSEDLNLFVLLTVQIHYKKWTL